MIFGSLKVLIDSSSLCMQKNGFTKFILVLVIIVILSTVGFLLTAKNSQTTSKPSPSSVNEAQSTPSATPAVTNLQYRNEQYGFTFALPPSWEGYTIVTNEWKGSGTNGGQGEMSVEKGPLLSIRHPLWTTQKPRQDIPIMIFTLTQWDLLQQDKFHIGAAPINPHEFGRNSKYVFALPARYNFAFPEGYEEVERIVENRPLEVF